MKSQSRLGTFLLLLLTALLHPALAASSSGNDNHNDARVVKPEPYTAGVESRDDNNSGDGRCDAQNKFSVCPAATKYLKENLDKGCEPDWARARGMQTCDSPLQGAMGRELPKCTGLLANCLCGSGVDERLLRSWEGSQCRNCTCGGGNPARREEEHEGRQQLDARGRRRNKTKNGNYTRTSGAAMLISPDQGHSLGLFGSSLLTVGLLVASFVSFWGLLA